MSQASDPLGAVHFFRGGNSDVPLSVKGAPHSSSLVRGFCPHGFFAKSAGG